MNKVATNIVNKNIEKVAKFGKTKSAALDVYKYTAAKQGMKINPKTLKAIALGAGGIAGATAIDKAVKKHDEKKLQKDTKVRFRRDILMPGAKRTAKQMAVGAIPIASAVLGATYLRHRPKKSGHVFSNMAQAKKYSQGHRVFQPEQARKLLKNSMKVGGAAYVGSKFYLRDRDLRDRAKVTGQEIKPSDRVMNALVPVARKKLPKSIKSTGIGSALALSTPEAQIQLKRQKEESKNKMNKKAFDLVENSFEKIAASVKEVKSPTVLRNIIPNPKGLKARLQQPENFRYNSDVYTEISPIAYGNNKDTGYEISTLGFGRKSDFLEAKTNLIDVVKAKKSESELNEYNSRVANPKKALKKAYNRPTGVKDVLTLGIARKREKYKAGKELLNSLTPEERDLLVQTRQEYAQRYTQNPFSAESVKATYHY